MWLVAIVLDTADLEAQTLSYPQPKDYFQKYKISIYTRVSVSVQGWGLDNPSALIETPFLYKHRGSLDIGITGVSISVQRGGSIVRIKFVR